jgi:nucleoside-triphosphatase THEP1
MLLCQDTEHKNYLKYGRFYFDRGAISFGEELLESGPANAVRIIDEVGLLELNGNIWAPAIRKLLKQDDLIMIITVRDSFVDEVIHTFDLNDVKLIQLSEPASLTARRILKQID